MSLTKATALTKEADLIRLFYPIRKSGKAQTLSEFKYDKKARHDGGWHPEIILYWPMRVSPASS
jgi:hypothetical protein